MENATTVTRRDVFLYVPNLIGYTRIILTAAAVISMFAESVKLMVFFYALSELLDAADGYFARRLNQCSKFGEVLDMVTDRSSTACLLVYLARLYPSWAVIICGVIALDLSSHYMQMYSSLLMGAGNHKHMSESAHPIMKAYYTDRRVLFGMCFGNEAFFLLAYYLHYQTGVAWTITCALALVAFPVCLTKNAINLVQLVDASKQLVDADLAQKDQKKN